MTYFWKVDFEAQLGRCCQKLREHSIANTFDARVGDRYGTVQAATIFPDTFYPAIYIWGVPKIGHVARFQNLVPHIDPNFYRRMSEVPISWTLKSLWGNQKLKRQDS